jgi:hypothetical protein
MVALWLRRRHSLAAVQPDGVGVAYLLAVIVLFPVVAGWVGEGTRRSRCPSCGRAEVSAVAAQRP